MITPDLDVLPLPAQSLPIAPVIVCDLLFQVGRDSQIGFFLEAIRPRREVGGELRFARRVSSSPAAQQDLLVACDLAYGFSLRSRLLFSLRPISWFLLMRCLETLSLAHLQHSP